MAVHTTITKRKRAKQDPHHNVSKFIKLSDADVIYVEVGTFVSKTFIVHRDTICKQSPFFKDSCVKHDSRKDVQTIKLPEVDPELFEEYLSWVYTRETELDQIAEASEGPRGSLYFYRKNSPYIRTMVDFWLLGEVCKDDEFKNRAIRHLLSLEFPSAQALKGDPGLLEYISRKATSTSALGRWLVDALAQLLATVRVSEEVLGAWPQSVVVKVLQKMADRCDNSLQRQPSVLGAVEQYF